MYKRKKILAIIPARGGSKGIKNKNIVKIGDKPLIAYSINSALESEYIDKIIVSTDSEKIAEVSREYGVDVPFLRPEELAKDESKTIDTILHVIDTLKNNNEKYDYFILLQPTSPFRKKKHIDESIKKIIDNEEEGLISVNEVEDHPLLIRTIENGRLKNLLDKNCTVRRQDCDKYYTINGSIYINKINENLDENTSLCANKLPYLMEKEYSIDIDDLLDLKYAEFLQKEYKF